MSIKKQISNLNDEQIISSYRDGHNMEDIAILYLKYSHMIFGTCMKYLKDIERSKDASMEIFEILTSKLKTHEVKYFKSWLYVLTRNHCLMIFRKDKKIIEYNDETLENREDDQSITTQLSELKEKKIQALEEAIQELKPIQKKCIELFFLKSKSYGQIAIEIDEDSKAVKSYIQNAKRNLKLYIQKHHVFE